MSPTARADDSHDGRYTHPTSTAAPAAKAGGQYPKMLHGKPSVKDGTVVRDTKVVTSKAQEDEEMKSGAWKLSPAEWNEKGFARIGALLLTCVLALVLGAATLFGQAALTLTTLAAALPAPTQGNQQQQVNLASATNVAIGQGLYIDTEYMRVVGTTPSSTIFTVARGQQGTPSQSHNSGTVVFVGSPTYFADHTQVAGGCTSTGQIALPHIDVISGQIANCPAVNTLAGSAAASWDTWFYRGAPVSSPARYTAWTYVTAGALTIQSGVSFIGSGGVLAMTLADPTKAMNGLLMTIQASTAQAHTVTYTAGFYGTTTSSDVATFGGAIGDNMVIYASNGGWRILELHNVTIG